MYFSIQLYVCFITNSLEIRAPGKDCLGCMNPGQERGMKKWDNEGCKVVQRHTFPQWPLLHSHSSSAGASAGFVEGLKRATWANISSSSFNGGRRWDLFGCSFLSLVSNWKKLTLLNFQVALFESLAAVQNAKSYGLKCEFRSSSGIARACKTG